jgi:hypothetical protein
LRSNSNSEKYIKLFILSMLVSLLVPFHPSHLSAAELPPVPYEQTALQKPSEAEIQEAVSKSLTAKAERLVGKHGGQCVIFVRNFSGVGRDKVQGLAKNTKVNSKDPAVGAIIVIYASKYGHVGVVLFTDEKYAYYVHSNGSWTERIAISKIPLNDKRIKGYQIN